MLHLSNSNHINISFEQLRPSVMRNKSGKFGKLNRKQIDLVLNVFFLFNFPNFHFDILFYLGIS